MSKSILLTQYADDGSRVDITVDTGLRVQARTEQGEPAWNATTDGQREPVMVPVVEVFSFGPMPKFTDATGKKRFTVDAFVGQCEKEVQYLIESEGAHPAMVSR